MSQSTTIDAQKGTPTVKGLYKNIFQDNSRIEVEFTADERGFLPKIKYRFFQPVQEIASFHINRIPASAIATLAGGGIG